MRPIWKGAISFGLVNIPISLYPAEEHNELKFHLIDSRDDNKIKYKRVNEVTGEEVPWETIVRAYEFEDGEYVVMTDRDFERADLSATKTVDIENFIRQEELPLVYLDRPYYVGPASGGEKPYVLLREVMKKTGKIAVARVVIRTRGYLAVLYPLDDVLVLNLVKYHDEIRPVGELKIPGSAKISEKEMELAESLIDKMAAEWKPEDYSDEYREAVMKRIEAKSKRKGQEPVAEEGDEEDAIPSGKVVDIMDLLKKSVEGKKKSGQKETHKKSG